MSGVEAVLGLAASGAGLLSLAMQLFESAQKLRTFSLSVKNAPRTLGRLTTACQNMGALLQELDSYSQEGDVEQSLLIAGFMTACQHDTVQLRETFQGIQRSAHEVGKLKWTTKLQTAFKEPELKKMLDELDIARNWLQFAFQIYHARQLRMQVARLPADISASLLEHLTLLDEADQRHETRTAQLEAKMNASVLAASQQKRLATTDSIFQPTRATRPGRPPEESVQRQWHMRFYCSWLSSHIWDLTLLYRPGGLHFNYHAYRKVPSNSKIALSCQRDDLRLVQELLTTGEATLMDCFETPWCQVAPLIFVRRYISAY